MLPLGLLGQNHVNMAHKNQRPVRRFILSRIPVRSGALIHMEGSRKAGQEISPAGSTLVNLRIDPFLFKNLLNVIKRHFFISRWICGIDSDQIL